EYTQASGQTINLEKSSIAFSSNSPRSIRMGISSILQISNMDGQDKFLGLPLELPQSKALAFTHIRNKIHHNIADWKEKLLSKKGKEVLLIAVTKAILVYAGWRVISNPNSLLARVLKGKYFPHTSFLNATLGSNPSWGWRSILWGRQVRWQVNNGNLIMCKHEMWIPKSFPKLPKVKESHDISTVWVSQLLHDNECSWDIAKLRINLYEEEVQSIMAIPVPIHRKDDKLISHFTHHGNYSLKSGYEIAYQFLQNSRISIAAGPGPSTQGNLSRLWKDIWKLKLPK
ncbi:hypothetical protein P3X46_003431, partial [Hevea brasiliensis]